MFLGRPQASLLLIVPLLKAVHKTGLVSICHCKGGRFLSFREAFGLVTCPLLFFTLPSYLERPASYSSLLDLVFFSSEGYECDRASKASIYIYIRISSQGW